MSDVNNDVARRYRPAPSLDRDDARLERGQRGESVRALQKKLNEGGAGLKVDGLFGKKTEAALKQFQRSHGNGQATGYADKSFFESGSKPPVQLNPSQPPSAGRPPVTPPSSPATPPSQPTAPTAPTRPPSGSQPAPVSGPSAPTPVNGAGPAPKPPPAAFSFASRGVPASEIRDMAKQHGRGNFMVGFDAGNIQSSALQAANETGARKHIYVEGPGGPTGNAWAPDEMTRVRNAARSVGIDTSRGDWMNQWNKQGWRDYTYKQLGDFKKKGFESAEIDNMYRDPRIKEDPKGTVNFLKEYGEKWKKGELPTLMQKNLTEPVWKAVNQAIKSGELPRGMFSDFAISESGVGNNRDTQARMASEVGIKLIKSNNTHDYDAKGRFDVRPWSYQRGGL